MDKIRPGHADVLREEFGVTWQWVLPNNPHKHPSKDGRYVVVVQYPIFGLEYATVSESCGGRWKDVAPDAIIARWLDGLELP